MAGFRDFAYGTVPALTFYSKFWHKATDDRMSVVLAARAAIYETREQYRNGQWRDNPTGGTESFMSTPIGADADIWTVRWGD